MNRKWIVVCGLFLAQAGVVQPTIRQPTVTQPSLPQPYKTGSPATATTAVTVPTTANVGKTGTITTNVVVPNNYAPVPGTSTNPIQTKTSVGNIVTPVSPPAPHAVTPSPPVVEVPPASEPLEEAVENKGR